jgi:hypothetical protein
MNTTTISTDDPHNPQELAAKRVEQFVQIRDRLRQMNDEHEARCKPLLEVKALLEGWMQQFLQQSGATSVKTTKGTFYQTVRHSSSLADPDAFMRYVIDHKEFNLLDRRANTTAVREFVKDHKALPPGVNLNTINTVGVRRGNEKLPQE